MNFHLFTNWLLNSAKKKEKQKRNEPKKKKYNKTLVSYEGNIINFIDYYW